MSRRCRSRTGSTARLYALLKLPDMPELRKRAKASGKRGKDWMTAFAVERRDVKTGSIKYADAKREAARLKRVEGEKKLREEKKLAASAAPPPVHAYNAPRPFRRLLSTHPATPHGPSDNVLRPIRWPCRLAAGRLLDSKQASVCALPAI